MFTAPIRRVDAPLGGSAAGLNDSGRGVGRAAIDVRGAATAMNRDETDCGVHYAPPRDLSSSVYAKVAAVERGVAELMQRDWSGASQAAQTRADAEGEHDHHVHSHSRNFCNYDHDTPPSTAACGATVSVARAPQLPTAAAKLGRGEALRKLQQEVEVLEAEETALQARLATAAARAAAIPSAFPHAHPNPLPEPPQWAVGARRLQSPPRHHAPAASAPPPPLPPPAPPAAPPLVRLSPARQSPEREARRYQQERDWRYLPAATATSEREGNPGRGGGFIPTPSRSPVGGSRMYPPSDPHFVAPVRARHPYLTEIEREAQRARLRASLAALEREEAEWRAHIAADEAEQRREVLDPTHTRLVRLWREYEEQRRLEAEALWARHFASIRRGEVVRGDHIGSLEVETQTLRCVTPQPTPRRQSHARSRSPAAGAAPDGRALFASRSALGREAVSVISGAASPPPPPALVVEAPSSRVDGNTSAAEEDARAAGERRRRRAELSQNMSGVLSQPPPANRSYGS